MLLDQQRQINELKQRLGIAGECRRAVNAHAAIGEVASTKPMVPPAPAAPPAFSPEPTATAAADARARTMPPSSPLQFKIGDAYFTPVGFMDMTSVTRSTNPGSGIGTNFGSIPYGNAQAGALTRRA